MSGGQSQAAARRVLRMLSAMRGKTFTGVSNADLARALGESPSNITRMLSVAIDEGFVTRNEEGRFTLSVAMLQIAQAHAEHSARISQRITEVNQRIAAGVKAGQEDL